MELLSAHSSYCTCNIVDTNLHLLMPGTHDYDMNLAVTYLKILQEYLHEVSGPRFDPWNMKQNS
jgi:hypothetical protein